MLREIALCCIRVLSMLSLLTLKCMSFLTWKRLDPLGQMFPFTVVHLVLWDNFSSVFENTEGASGSKGNAISANVEVERRSWQFISAEKFIAISQPLSRLVLVKNRSSNPNQALT